MKKLKAGMLNPRILQIRFESGNSVIVECHAWITGPVGRVVACEVKGGRLQGVGEYAKVAWVREVTEEKA